MQHALRDAADPATEAADQHGGGSVRRATRRRGPGGGGRTLGALRLAQEMHQTVPSKELKPGLSPQVPSLPSVLERSVGGEARSDAVDMRVGLM
eukprot:8302952-Alexandrium_andersonii.AAC.1